MVDADHLAEMRKAGMLLADASLGYMRLSPPYSAASILAESHARWGHQEVPEDAHSDKPRRYLSRLKGGTVPRLDCQDPIEAAHADELLRRNLPVVLTGGCVIGRESAVGGWTSASLLERLEGTCQCALVAPPAAARRFTFYNPKNHSGDYEVSSFFRPVDSDEGPATSAAMRAAAVDAEFARARHGGEQEPAAYLQMRVFHRSEGGFDACELPGCMKAELQASVDWEALRALVRRGIQTGAPTRGQAIGMTRDLCS